MVVGRDYMLHKPEGPSAARVFLDQRVVPVVVNAAGWAEVALVRVAARAGVRPAVIVGGGACLAGLLLLRALRRPAMHEPGDRRAGGHRCWT